LLNSGSLLTRFGFNIGANKIGFNDKNRKTRKTAVNQDTVRKFFKDTKSDEIRTWYKKDLQNWFHAKRAFDRRGLFVLDQSRLVVPNNKNYAGAVKMPVDEHGQWYSNLGCLTTEQKRSLIYHPCYTFSTLLNVGLEGDNFHVAGYELGAGNEDELVQAEKLIPNFCRQFKDVMKILILDRGYIDGNFIQKIKRDYNVDVLIPLRKNMDDYQEAIAIANLKNNWEIVEQIRGEDGHLNIQKEIAAVEDIDLWSKLDYKVNAIATRYTTWDAEKEEYRKNHSVLISTKKYTDPKMMITHYDLRMQVEERFRQFKHDWYIKDFPSPHDSLIESHVCFTLLTYSLLQLYLRREDLREITHRMISALRREECLGKEAVLVYAQNKFGIFDLDDYTVRVAGLQELPRTKLIALMEAQKEIRLKRNK
jgi:hypothetical protein